MKHGIVLLGFGEPETTSRPAIEAYLERIFTANAALRAAAGDDALRRARRSAEARAPALMAEYERIGGSPHDRQLRWQAEALERVLRLRGLDAPVRPGCQFTDPSIRDALEDAREAGVDRLVALPTYPLPGPSTTDAALAQLERERDRMGWHAPVVAIRTWHREPIYVALRAEAVRRTAARAGLSLRDPRARLVFSAHGTPLAYLRDGSGYVAFVEELCAAVAHDLGVSDYVIGYQNHDSGPDVDWTEPAIEDVIAGLDADAVVVDPVSFMHEQSETLAELDHALRAAAEGRGLRFYRVRIPWDAVAFIDMLADRVEACVAPSSPAARPA